MTPSHLSRKGGRQYYRRHWPLTRTEPGELNPVGLPRAYLGCLLFVKHSFAETGPGGALRGLLATGKYSAPVPAVRSQLSKIITIIITL